MTRYPQVFALCALALACRAQPSQQPRPEPAKIEAPSSELELVSDWETAAQRWGERRWRSPGRLRSVGDALLQREGPEGQVQLWRLDGAEPTVIPIVTRDASDEPCSGTPKVGPEGRLALAGGWLCALEPTGAKPETLGLEPLVEAPKGTKLRRVGPGDVRLVERRAKGKDAPFFELWPNPGDTPVERHSALDPPAPDGLEAYAYNAVHWLDESQLLLEKNGEPLRVLALAADGTLSERCTLGADPPWMLSSWTEAGVTRVLTAKAMTSPTVWRVGPEGCFVERSLPAEAQWFRFAEVTEGPTGKLLWLFANPVKAPGDFVLRAIPLDHGQLGVGASSDSSVAIDWSPPPLDALPPTGPWPELELSTARLGEEPGSLRFELVNRGAASSWLTRVAITSEPADALPGGFVELPLGRLEPGDSREVELALPIVAGWETREVGLTLRVHDARERSSAGRSLAQWPALVPDAAAEAELAETIVQRGAALLDAVTGERQPVTARGLSPAEFGFYAESSSVVKYQRIHGMEPEPLAVNREVWQARSPTELEHLIAPMQWWLLCHELGHTRIGWGGWGEELRATWIGVHLTRRLLEQSREAPLRPDSMRRFYAEVERRLAPRIAPELAARVRAFLVTRGETEPERGLFEGFTPSTVLPNDPVTYVWFLARVALWALDQPETLEQLLDPREG